MNVLEKGLNNALHLFRNLGGNTVSGRPLIVTARIPLRQSTRDRRVLQLLRARKEAPRQLPSIHHLRKGPTPASRSSRPHPQDPGPQFSPALRECCISNPSLSRKARPRPLRACSQSSRACPLRSLGLSSHEHRLLHRNPPSQAALPVSSHKHACLLLLLLARWHLPRVQSTVCPSLQALNLALPPGRAWTRARLASPTLLLHPVRR